MLEAAVALDGGRALAGYASSSLCRNASSRTRVFGHVLRFDRTRRARIRAVVAATTSGSCGGTTRYHMRAPIRTAMVTATRVLLTHAREAEGKDRLADRPSRSSIDYDLTTDRSKSGMHDRDRPVPATDRPQDDRRTDPPAVDDRPIEVRYVITATDGLLSGSWTTGRPTPRSAESHTLVRIVRTRNIRNMTVFRALGADPPSSKYLAPHTKPRPRAGAVSPGPPQPACRESGPRSPRLSRKASKAITI